MEIDGLYICRNCPGLMTIDIWTATENNPTKSIVCMACLMMLCLLMKSCFCFYTYC